MRQVYSVNYVPGLDRAKDLPAGRQVCSPVRKAREKVGYLFGPAPAGATQSLRGLSAAPAGAYRVLATPKPPLSRAGLQIFRPQGTTKSGQFEAFYLRSGRRSITPRSIGLFLSISFGP